MMTIREIFVLTTDRFATINSTDCHENTYFAVKQGKEIARALTLDAIRTKVAKLMGWTDYLLQINPGWIDEALKARGWYIGAMYEVAPGELG